MLKYIVLLLLCLSTLCQSALAQQPAAKVLDQLQLQRFPALQPFTLKDLDPAKPTYLKLWASWCKPCLEQMPHFQQLQQTYGDKINFVAVNININENRQDIRQVIQRFGLTMPVVLDQQGQLGVALGLVGTPYSVLLNPQQQMVYSSHESDAALDGFLGSGRADPSAEISKKPTESVSLFSNCMTVSNGEKMNIFILLHILHLV